MDRRQIASIAVKGISVVVVGGVLVWHNYRTRAPTQQEELQALASAGAPPASAAGERARNVRRGLIAGMQENAQSSRKGQSDGETPLSESARRAVEWMNDRYSPELDHLVFERHFASLEKLRTDSDDDLKWSGEMEDGIQELFKNDLSALGALEMVACRGYLCRLEASIAVDDNLSSITREIQRAMRLDQATVHALLDQDRFVAYFAREGRILPEWNFEEYVAPEMAAAEKDEKLWPITRDGE